MLRSLISRIGDLVVPLLPNRCKDMLISRQENRMGPALAAKKAIAKAWRNAWNDNRFNRFTQFQGPILSDSDPWMSARPPN
jgi:hypothetical protein